jgi:lysophospholipase L1-like esterase
VISKAQNSKAMQAAKNAYTEYIIEQNGTAAEYMIYDADGRFVALHNGAAVGVYASKEVALKALYDNPDTPENEAENYISVPMTGNEWHLCCEDFSELTYVAFGDSITYGIDGNSVSGADRKMAYPYPTLVKDTLKIGNLNNQAVSGASFCPQEGRTNMTNKILNFNGTADIISLMLGVNDFWDGLPLGDISSPMENTTIYGSLNLIAKHLTTKHSNSFIFFITPFQCKREYNGTYTLEDVTEAIKTVAAQYNIPVLDMYAYGKYELEMNDSAVNDGIHPSQQHHIKYTAPLISEFILKNYGQNGNYTPNNESEKDDTHLAPGTHVIDYREQSLMSGYVTSVNNAISINGTNGPHKHFTVSAVGVDTITITPGGAGPNNSLCYVIYVNEQGIATSYAPIKGGDTTVIALGGTATGTLYFNYYKDNDAVYVLQATIVAIDTKH